MHYYFRWIDPRTRELLPFQEPQDFGASCKPQSWLHVTLQPNSHAFLIWNFPFEHPDADFHRYLDFVRRMAPVEMPDRHFRLMVPNKKGTDYVARKINLASGT